MHALKCEKGGWRDTLVLMLLLGITCCSPSQFVFFHGHVSLLAHVFMTGLGSACLLGNKLMLFIPAYNTAS